MRSIFDVYLAKRDEPSDEAVANLSLPARPYEMLDALEKVRPDSPAGVDLMVEEYHGYQYLARHILPQPDLYGLNALAEKLSELTEDEAIAFHGLVQMEADKQNSRLSIQRLLDLAYSTDCCHVVDALNDGQLGLFYADNGFVPEAENLSDEAYDLLNFEQIGRKMRKGEDGTFVERSADGPGGYVVRHEELKQAPPIPTGPPQKPDYIFRLYLWLISAISIPSHGKRRWRSVFPPQRNRSWPPCSSINTKLITKKLVETKALIVKFIKYLKGSLGDCDYRRKIYCTIIQKMIQ